MTMGKTHAMLFWSLIQCILHNMEIGLQGEVAPLASIFWLNVRCLLCVPPCESVKIAQFPLADDFTIPESGSCRENHKITG